MGEWVVGGLISKNQSSDNHSLLPRFFRDMPRTRRIVVSVTPVLPVDRNGNTRNSPHYIGDRRGERVQELALDMPIRDRDGQRVSRDYLRDMANYPDSPNNLLYDKIREAMINEWPERWEEYGMTFVEHMHSDSLDG